MINTVIKVENLSKQYRLGLVGPGTLSHDLNRWWAKLLGKEDPALKIGSANRLDTVDGEFIWALKDINFEVKQGEVLGIIGKNGAGKSTLLKILSRVTGPTIGSVKIKGRIASLLEVGTGFHPELTGKENIFLNGAILGMTKSEIKSKFDEIVSFSGVERYIDTPVKRYSSGMYVRLAFAVAAHLEPEILIIDEVLAVGDAEFQKKCLGKMKNVAGQGRTVLFVSHNMAAISSLCSKSLVLIKGGISFEGNTESAIDHYLGLIEHVKGYSELQDRKSDLWKRIMAFSRLISIETLDQESNRKSVFKMGGALKIRIGLDITGYRKNIELGIFVRDARQEILGLFSSAAEGFDNLKAGFQEIEVDVPCIALMPGEYSLGIWVVHDRQVDDACDNAIEISVISDNFTGNFVDFDRFKEYGTMIRSNWNLSEN